MRLPTELTFREVKRTADTEALIARRSEKLTRYSDRIVSCRVAVEKPHEHQRSGSPYRVRIEVTLPPARDLAVTRDPGDGDIHDELSTVINSAFDAMERRIERTTDKDHGHVKTHDEPRALVVRIFRDMGYGFIETPEGEEIYFHENSVLHDDFARLAVGTEVRFESVMGDDGPQATSVQVVNKPGEQPGDEAPDMPEQL